MATLMLIAAAILALSPTPASFYRAAQTNDLQEPPHENPLQMPKHFPPDLEEKQKKKILQANLEKARKDSEELASLAHALQKELESNGEATPSTDVAVKSEQIEKLARKIRSELMEY
jgi:hypothetical protein